MCLGAAFLTPVEAIEDATRSVKWALGHGADLAVVFPMHVKPHTLLRWLHDRGLYSPPSLWSLIEVLARIEPELLPRATISWHRNNNGPAAGSVVSPTTCERCRERVLAMLDRFREEPSVATLADLRSQECKCKERWREDILRLPEVTLPERVCLQYDWLARDFGLSEWWAAHGEGIRADVLDYSPEATA